MRSVILEPVDNGLVKIARDDNYDGAGKLFSEKKIYVLDATIESTEKFLIDLIDDLGLFVGNDYDKSVLSFQKSFGAKYKLKKTDILEERKKTAIKLTKLKTHIEYANVNH